MTTARERFKATGLINAYDVLGVARALELPAVAIYFIPSDFSRGGAGRAKWRVAFRGRTSPFAGRTFPLGPGATRESALAEAKVWAEEEFGVATGWAKIPGESDLGQVASWFPAEVADAIKTAIKRADVVFDRATGRPIA